MEGLEAPVGLALTQTQATHWWLLDLLSAGENNGGSQTWGEPLGDLAAASPPGLARGRQARWRKRNCRDLRNPKLPCGDARPRSLLGGRALSEVGLCRRG